MATIKRIGFGQVEPNHLSAQRTGQIYAQLIADKNLNVIENGMFLKYDYANRKAVADASVAGEWLLVYNEEKLYDPRKQSHKDFAMVKTDYVDGEMVPRLFKTNIGDIYTTNMVKTGVEYAVGNKLTPKKVTTGTGADAYDTLQLELAGNDDKTMIFVVVKVYTMPDGQPGLKLQRVA
jgi:uncharacterized protein YuzB (UPF0349 family)